MAEQIAHTKNEKIEQFGRICFYAGLLLELLIVILDKSSWINPLEGQMFRVSFLLFACKLCVTKYSKKEWLAVLAAGVIAGLCYLSSDRDEAVRAVDLSKVSKEPFLMLKKNQDSYKRSMDICAHAGFEPKVIMYFDQLQTAYNVARSGQSGIIFFRDALLKYTEKTEKLCYYKIGDPLAKRAILLSMKRYPGVGATVDDFIKYILLAKK